MNRQRSNTIPCQPSITRIRSFSASPVENTPYNTPNSPCFKPMKQRTHTLDTTDKLVLPSPSSKVLQQSNLLNYTLLVNKR